MERRESVISRLTKWFEQNKTIDLRERVTLQILQHVMNRKTLGINHLEQGKDTP